SRAVIEAVSAGRMGHVRVSYAPQEPALPEWLRVGEALRLFGVDGAVLAERMPGLLLGEVLRARVSHLSGGQRQIVGVAAALAVPTDMVLLDEPFAALDMRRRRGLMDLLAAVRIEAPERTVVVASQVAADLFELATWLIVLSDRRYAFRGPRAELLQRDAHADALTFERRLFAVMDGAVTPSPTSATMKGDPAGDTESTTAHTPAADAAEHS
ncbi:MAG: ATP-binding cassette domain-containing protein, partial [Longimicrobiales bacterium]